MIQILENIIMLIGWTQISLSLTNTIFEFFNLIEPALSSLAIISGLFYFLYEKFIVVPSSLSVTLTAKSDILRDEKKIKLLK